MRSWVGIEEGNIYKNVSYVKCGNECSHVSWECSTYYIYIYIIIVAVELIFCLGINYNDADSSGDDSTGDLKGYHWD